jgi:translation initiation factor eIF-2B subunit epsilon
MSPVSEFKHFQILKSTSSSVGDVMRDLDKRAVMQNDFFVVYGDVVANVDLELALKAHKARKAKDKNAIMTMILREQRQSQEWRTQDIFVIDPGKDRCLHYEAMRPGQSGRLNLDPELVSAHEELEIRTDLLDTGIDICTPDVLALWTDNFDFQVPRRGFLYSVLKDYELNGKTIHVHVERERYAQRAKSLRTYAELSTDVVGRLACPFVPDNNLPATHAYRLAKGFVYKEPGVVLARSCHIGRVTVLGKGTSVGEGTVIENSIIGRDCIIGRNVRIEGAYIWNNANIGDGCVVKGAIVADEAAIGKKCVVEPGALISFGVRIADSTSVQGKSRITRMKRKREDDEGLERAAPDVRIVGEGGDGFEYVDEDEGEENAAEDLPGSSSLLYGISNLALSAESISTLNDDDDISDEIYAPRNRSSVGSFGSIGSDDSTTGQTAAQARDFHHEAYTSILDSLNRRDDSANIQLELSALKLSANASEHQVRRAVTTAIVRFISQQTNSGTTVQAAVDKLLPAFKVLLQKTMFDQYDDEKGDQVDFMLLLQHECVHQEKGEDILARLTYKLSVTDVIESEGLEQWWEDPKSAAEGGMAKVRTRTKQIVNAVVGGSDEESEDEDDSDEEED